MVSAAQARTRYDRGASNDDAAKALEPARALRQLRRILVPGGRLLFIEHVASDESGLRRWQDRMHWLNRIVGHGCECNRATLDSILAAGFSVSDLRRDTLPRVPAILRPLLIGCAESTKQPRPSAGSSPAPGQGSCEAAQSSSIQVCGGRYTSTRPSRSRTGSLGSEGSTWGSFWFSTSPDGVNHTPWHGHSSRPAA